MTGSPGDTANEAPAKGKASPEATGGIGTSYEHVCIAAYLSALLTRSYAPVCPGVVTSIALQQAAKGRPLDDIVIGWTDDGGRAGTVDLQLKRRLPLSASEDSDFSAIVADAWATMKRTDFVDRRDCAGGLSEIVSSDNLNACQKLRELAAETDPADFATVVATQVDRAARKAHDAVRTILTRTLGAPPSDQTLHFFWRNFVIGRLEATATLGIDRLRAIDLLRGIAPQDGANPIQLFAVLEALARQLNVHAARIDRDTLIRLLAERFGTLLPSLPGNLRTILTSAREGATLELVGFREHVLGQLVDPLFTTRDGKGRDGDRIVALDAVEAELRTARSLVVTGEPGAGKSSALGQLAVTLLAQPDVVPIVRSLPALAVHQIPIVSQLCRKGSFGDLSEADFAALARSGQIILLFDGWNELNPEQRLWAWSELDTLRRDYPALMLVVATREGTASPFAQPTTLEIRAFDRDRQLDAAARLLGPAGHDLAIRARALSALRPLLRTPLFLSAILEQGASGYLPSDRETVIAGLVSGAGGTPARREQLRLALDGQHKPFLQAIADRLMTAGTTFLPEADLLPVVGEVAADLRARHLLAQPVAAQAVLDLLISHHLMVGIGAPGERTIGFQHQLIQEWFASHRVEIAIANQQGGLVDAALCRLIDAPFWSVAILFAVDRLNRSASSDAPLRALIRTTLGIEPFLAAEIFCRAGDSIGRTLDGELMAFAERWTQEDPVRANMFMLATGLPQFADPLWATLKTKGELAFGLHRSGRPFPTGALELEWDRHFPTLQSQTRRVLLADLIEQGDASSLQLAVRSAAKDRSVDVVAGAIDYLDFREERAALEQLLDALSKPMWAELSSGRMPESLTDRHRARWQRTRRKRFKRAEGLEWINLALEFDCAAPAVIVAKALDLETESHWSSYALEQRLFERFPAIFQTALVSRLLTGDGLPHRAAQYLLDVEPVEQEALLAIARAKDGQFYRRQLAAQLLGREAIAGLVDHMMSCAGDRAAFLSPASRETRDALACVRADLLVSDILRRTAADSAQAALLVSILCDWRGGEDERDFAISPADHETLRQRVEQWSALFLAEPDLPRSDLADLARVIDRLADGELLPTLIALWDQDYARQSAQRAAQANDPNDPKAREAHMGYGVRYRAAALAIGGEAVVQVMTRRLDNPDYEHDAAIVLGQLLEVDPAKRGPIGPTMDDRATRHARLIERRASPPHPVAAKILDRVDALMAVGDSGSVARAFKLAAPATLLNYGDRGGTFLNLIEVGKDSGLLHDFCKAFAQRGEALPSSIVRHGLAGAVAELAAMKWVHENEYWRVEQWLSLIAFADDTLAALPPPDVLAGDFVRPYRLRDLVSSIGHSISPTAVAALVELLRRAPELFNDSWPDAIARLGAGDVLLDAVLHGSGDPKMWRDSYPLRQALATALAHSSNARARAIAALADVQPEGKRAALADALAQTMDEEEAILLLAYVAERQDAVIARVLISRLEQAGLSRKPVDGLANAVELEAAPLPRLRQRAFRALLENPERPDLRSVLQAIDHLRDDYGKPVTEPNHPDLDSGRAWPISAEPLWLLPGCRTEGAA